MLSLALSRLSVKCPNPISNCFKFRGICCTNSLLVQTTPILFAEPLKKKKKIDPQIIRQREERKKKKLEKQIRRLERNARQLKPIDELEVPLVLIDEKQQRTRSKVEATPEELTKRSTLHKEWARYKLNEKISDFELFDKITAAQEKALNELRKVSEDLYQEAIQPDLKLLPYTTKGPVSTPPIKDYQSPDGEYIDISKKWE